MTQTQVQRKVEACYQLAESQLQRAFPRPEISFALRGQSAGAAHLQQNKLRFNPVLLEQNLEAFINEVVPHEVAHLLTWQLYGRVRPHGREWQGIMWQIFQVEPKTKHQFDVSSVQQRQFAYRCGCQSHNLSIRRHNKVRRGQVQYQCRRCGDTLMAVAD
ncbi:SprT family zinc-dependent metalloprotease [Ferrimonas aestuarii]|uniref:Protein SprT n=1 Tax=Ferrimonas aestuarii TaxID=2569539 RepID=A0A4U1BLN4_9GAMM|nr:SprT family zinc-dependent metalloprotease [Ferrimonas aestuarii]TKB53034.1 SprT family zinc-dependent metalloprotease [Ferrimonas aestuarii]